MLDQLSSGAVLTDAEGTVTFVNNAMTRLLGMPRAALLGARLESAGKDDSAAGRPPMLSVRSASGEAIALTPLGVQSRMSERLYLALGPEAAGEPNYRDIFEAAHDAMMVFGPERETILDVNQEACRLYGFTREEFIGMSVEAISTDIPSGKARIKSLLEDGGRMRFEVVHVRKDGSRVNVDINASPVVYNGRPAILSVNRDITLRKLAESRAEEEERRVQKQSRTIVELAREPLLHSGDLVPALRRVTEDAARTLGCDRVGIWLLDESRGVLATLDLYDAGVGHSLDRDVPFAAYPRYVQALESERVIASADARSDPRTSEFNDYFVQAGIVSTIDAPIRHAGRLIGLLCCEVKDARREWAVDEEMFASSMADLAGLAVAAADRKRTAEALRRRVEFDTLVTAISTEFVTLASEDIDAAIHRALERLALYDEADRAIVCILDPDSNQVTESFEWSRDAAPQLVEALRKQGGDTVPLWIDALLRFEPVIIPSVDELPPDSSERAFFDARGVRSILGVPMLFGRALFGFVAFETIDRERRWSEESVAALRLAGEIFASALEGKKTEEALRESESRFRSLIERMNEGVLQVDSDDRILFVNDRLCDLVGYKREELLGQIASDSLLGSEESRRVMRAQLALRARKVSDQYEVEMRRKSGEIRWFSISGAPVYAGTGAVTGSLGVVADITERKKAEAELKQSVSVLQSTLDSTADGILVVDHTGRIITHNARLLELWRIDAAAMPEWFDDLMSQTIVGQVSDPLAFLAHARELRHKPLDQRFDTIELTDGRIYERFSLPQRIDGVPVGRVWSFRDITEKRRAEEALRASEQRYRLLFERNLAGVYRNTLDGRVLDANDSCARMFGFDSREELLSRPADQFYYEVEDRKRLVDDLLRHGTLTNYEVCFRRRDGRSVWALENMTLIYDENGVPTEMEGTLIEITARKRAEEALRESEERYRLMAENSTDIISRHTVEGIYLYASPASKTLLGFLPEELVGQSLADLTHPDDRTRVADLQASWEAGDEPSGISYRICRADGKYVWLETTSRPLRNPETGQLLEIIAVSRDITERKEAEERIEYQAFHDALTGLPNRQLFKDRLTVALAHAKRLESRLAVMFLDLDQFKYVNDTLGHSAGDLLLVEIADRLCGAVREEDTVSRLGGDEFTLLLVDVTTEDAAIRIANKLLRAVESPMLLDGNELSVTTSIGIALFPNDGEDAEALLKNADAAMYRAKDSGRNTFHLCAPAMERRTLDKLAIERELRRAIERQEFVLHYQPQVSISDGHIIGVEALVRWNHPERGLIQPNDFISIAEESRLILPLGEWVLRESCRQLRAWHRAGHTDMRVAVNLSARQFQQTDLVEMVASILADSRVEGPFLEVEITESTAMQNTEWTRSVLVELKRMGISITMDDFGTGHSSLNYLKQFPIDCVKIDRDFIRDVADDESDAAIVGALITMARVLHLRVIAEGVETPEQVIFLQQRECQALQGFFFSHPVEADAISAMLRHDKERENARAAGDPFGPWAREDAENGK
jgi:diguanylate cyclase (GGDEF)-like protein/PAS domain S-box-containing protein